MCEQDKTHFADSDWMSVFFYLPLPELACLHNKQSKTTLQQGLAFSILVLSPFFLHECFSPEITFFTIKLFQYY